MFFLIPVFFFIFLPIMKIRLNHFLTFNRNGVLSELNEKNNLFPGNNRTNKRSNTIEYK